MLDHSPGYVDALDFYTAAGVITKLREKVAENRLWDVWLLRYPHMDKDNYESFKDYKDRHMGKTPKQKYTKSKDEILAEIQKIRGGKVVGTHGDI